MSDDALFNLRWDAQRSALLGSIASLYREEAYVDATIVADNKIYKAHKLILSASSSYLKHILESVPSSQHAVLFMPHISASDLGNVLKFIYDGEIKINRRSLKSFLSVAKLLRIKGMDFELNEDLGVNIPAGPSSSASGAASLPSPSSSVGHNNKRPATESTSTLKSDEEGNNATANNNTLTKTSSISSLTSSSQVKNEQRSSSPPPRDNNNGHSFSSVAQNNNENNFSQDEPKISRPAPVSSSGRSTDSISSQASNNAPSPSDRQCVPPVNNNQQNKEESSSSKNVSAHDLEDSVLEDSNQSDSALDNRTTALNLHIGRYHNDNESLDMDQDSHPATDDRDDHGIPIPDHDMDDEYDDDDDDDDHHFSMSIQPEVSLRESDESLNVHDRRHQSMQFKPTNFSNSLGNLPLLGGNSSMSITPTPTGSLSSNPPSLSLQQHITLKHLSKLARPMAPKAHQLPGQVSPQSAHISGINEGILMRMMREPLQGASSKLLSTSPNHGGFFDIPHGGDPNLHPAGMRKQKRYVQCTSCSKVLSSLSALKRHMEDVHCARIQGKCLLCGRVYSSRNSLLTHVYSAHKKHHDYKAVARIIRESDFEQFATA